MSFSGDLSARWDAAIGDILAPLLLRVQEANLNGKSVNFRVLNNFHALGPARVGIVADLVSGERIRKGIRVSGEDLRSGSVVEFRDDISHASLFLTLLGSVVDRVDLFGRSSPFANPRLALWQLGEGSIDDLKDQVKQARGRDLEKHIGLLFHLLGFTIQRFIKNEKEMPDLVAFPAKGEWLLAIECTTDTIDVNNKVVKLSGRTRRISALHGFRIIPIVATSLERKMVNQSDFDRAGTEQVAIITMTEVPELLRMAVEGIGNEKVLDYILSNIPSSRGLPVARPLL
jgi:hypothetical protein